MALVPLVALVGLVAVELVVLVALVLQLSDMRPCVPGHDPPSLVP